MLVQGVPETWNIEESVLMVSEQARGGVFGYWQNLLAYPTRISNQNFPHPAEPPGRIPRCLRWHRRVSETFV